MGFPQFEQAEKLEMKQQHHSETSKSCADEDSPNHLDCDQPNPKKGDDRDPQSLIEHNYQEKKSKKEKNTGRKARDGAIAYTLLRTLCFKNPVYGM